MIQSLFQPINSSLALSSPNHPSTLAFSFSPHPFPLLSSHHSKHHSLHAPRPQPPYSTASYNYLLPLLTFLLSSPCPIFSLLFGGPTYWHNLCPDTDPAVLAVWLQSISWFRALQRAIFLICFYTEGRHNSRTWHHTPYLFFKKKNI